MMSAALYQKDVELPSLPVEYRLEKLAICRNKQGSLKPSLLDKTCWPLPPCAGKRWVWSIACIELPKLYKGIPQHMRHTWKEDNRINTDWLIIFAKITCNFFAHSPKFCPSNFTHYNGSLIGCVVLTVSLPVFHSGHSLICCKDWTVMLKSSLLWAIQAYNSRIIIPVNQINDKRIIIVLCLHSNF